MKTLSIIAVSSSLIVVIFILFLSYYGLFAPVKMTEKNMGPYQLVYKKHVGDYKNVGPVMDSIYYDLKDNFSIETTKGFGLYYDNPKEVDKEKLRSIVGCIVEGKTADDLIVLNSKYGVKVFPESRSVVADLPYKGTISIILGIFKVYPKFTVYINEHKHAQTPIMEIYDQPNEKIEYISAVSLSKELFDEFLE